MKKLTSLASILLIGTVVLTGCGSKNNGGEKASPSDNSATQSSAASPSASASDSQSPSAEPVKKIIIGTGTKFNKICYIDENGKLTGFDVELIKEIDKRLPGYEFELQAMEFSNLLLSLETKKIDLIAHEMEKNPEREVKYLFNKEPYAHWRNKIAVKSDNNDKVETLDDLKGKKVIVGPTSAEAQLLINYNKDHNDAIPIIYSKGGSADYIKQISEGRAYATITADFSLPLIDPQHVLKTVGPDLSSADILFILRKDDPDEQKLADAVDGALKELKSDGTLGKLSKEWLGSDFTANAGS